MKGITGFRLRRAATSQAACARPRVVLPAALFDESAQSRVMDKLKAMGEGFYALSESEYGDWLDALPKDEFMEFMAVMIGLDDRARAARSSKQHGKPATPRHSVLN
jgi:hypothetical protein